MSVLSAEGICVSFGGIRALQDVHVRLRAGRIYGLIGPNGAGKTTLFNVLTGVISADSGRLMLAGDDVTSHPAHRRARAGLSRTFQNLALFPSMTVEQNVRAGLLGRDSEGWVATMLGLNKAQEESCQVVRALLRDMGLEQDASRLITELPLGSRKKVELARAIVSRPRVLLLDEPAAGLGAPEIKDLCNLVRKLQGAGTTVLVVEHHMAMVMSLCEEIFVLDFGTLIAQGTPGEIRRHPKVISAYLGTRADAHETV